MGYMEIDTALMYASKKVLQNPGGGERNLRAETLAKVLHFTLKLVHFSLSLAGRFK